MKVAQIKFSPWDKAYSFDPHDLNLKKGDTVLVKTEIGVELGEVVDIIDAPPAKTEGGASPEIKPVLRKANIGDASKMKEREACKKDAFETCKDLIKKYKLPMKLFDVRFSFDGGRITFAYIAPERVDFRELVKDLTRKFQKSIRMQQVGVREETRIFCNIGVCGREACCRRFLKDLGNVSLDQAYTQQVAHRGSERISGVCGRLLCCLNYEQPMYEKLSAALPPIGSSIKTKQGKGKVVNWHILKQSVEVKLEDGNKTEVKLAGE
ncbi:stage 0 sporulation protein [Patescibacteria group bacterium]|nr:stage 0 sporulation protein [Patescibacteria group bacterium]MBU4512428.1 stage 0 sporulation protein [Patescibacteria group bacterium]MCG2692722.1 stage 0 sporulation protein [Candidatus Parcubacteria bacterium]